MEPYSNQYSNDEITVTYEPSICIHAEKCANEMSSVFRTSIIPWINLDNAETKAVINQIKKCPSGALKYMNSRSKKAS
ncbi:MAG: (4Fe-4S)-binding protein [Flavobacteriales bacterium]|nr:(4Fe-4S)-binding protein [Flavobacteriia bacterium]NCP04779.1 (4Fe-4S)-binding protein [Flavobacteriales bacterium]PIV92698.1 MAG: (4Fe-4S)-binding protein [Flavobacteriaceae bacterium CG17_big_fil_post_rev_8_21_14_2_50_33_15]PIY11156.1 MAG: (4Fe-4S)-binding protein [Flavobacteriaceae bacterium CG_4_10_14_3_um_filter_33_47]PJB17841.1 MAG: (4Fe-4S)-binding protein [Flavobacteriaceae bacterium CG_4_9_14_3_um_filter_33_16]